MDAMADTVVAMTRKFNAQQPEKNLAKIGCKIINIKEICHD
jgi:hypothetical protein